MKIITDINIKSPFKCSCISIGNFDGLHLGHQFILNRLKKKNKKSAVITFTNHPLEIFKPHEKFNSIYTLDEKLKLLEDFGLDMVILLKFNKTLAELDFFQFLKLLKTNFSFEHLIAGEDIKIGKDRLGDKTNIKKLENQLNFKAVFIKKIKYQNKIISSTWIRSLIKEKNYALAEKLLNRHYKNKE